MLRLAFRFLRYNRYLFGPSSYSLRIAFGQRGPPNKSSANYMAQKTIIFVSLSCCRYFPLDFPVVFTVSISMNRFRYIIESCLSFQTVLFSGLRNISLQILRIVGRVWNTLRAEVFFSDPPWGWLSGRKRTSALKRSFFMLSTHAWRFPWEGMTHFRDIYFRIA